MLQIKDISDLIVFNVMHHEVENVDYGLHNLPSLRLFAGQMLFNPRESAVKTIHSPLTGLM